MNGLLFIPLFLPSHLGHEKSRNEWISHIHQQYGLQILLFTFFVPLGMSEW